MSERTMPVIYRGKRYIILMDGTGCVPIHALVQRFQQCGSVRDLNDNDQVLYPMRCRPQDIVAWWADPRNGDILGLDTRDSMVYDVSSVKGKAMRKAQRKIGVVTDSRIEQRRIRSVLESSFTASELDEMTRNGSFVIRTVPNCGGATGYYLRKQDGVEIPLIVIEERTTADGIVHEVVHHARTMFSRKGITRTAFPTRMDGTLDDDEYNSMSPREKKRINNAEEAMTVAETVARTAEDRMQSGYYDRIPERSARSAYIEDRHIMAGKPMSVPDFLIPRQKGKRAIRSVETNGVNTNIAMAEILSREPAKRSQQKLDRRRK